MAQPDGITKTVYPILKNYKPIDVLLVNTQAATGQLLLVVVITCATLCIAHLLMPV